jgi:predicted esterase
MRRNHFARLRGQIAVWMAAVMLCASTVRADDTIVLKDGRKVVGSVGTLTSMAESSKSTPADDAIRPIVFVDDNLRRVSFPKMLIREIRNGDAARFESINIKQPVAEGGHRIGSVGPLLRKDDFDAFGRMIVSMKADAPGGKLDMILGITSIHPVWTRVEALTRTGGPNIMWDMRVATSSIPRATLSKIFANHVSRKNVDERLKVVGLYLNAERYTDAQYELQEILADFPDLKPAEVERLTQEVSAIRQLGARRALDEIELRRKAGQHQLAQTLLSKFPTQDVAGAVLQEVKARQDEYQEQLALIESTNKSLAEVVAKIDDSVLRRQAEPCVAEILGEMNLATVDRMAAFRQFLDSATHTPANKTSLAISGWLLGSNDATDNLALSLSIYRVRGFVREYLAEGVELKRAAMLNQLSSEEGGTPRYIAKLLARMKPPVPTPPQEEPDHGAYALSVPALPGHAPANYLVQLPPEYDPYRRYPAIVTLCGGGTTPTQQINWWAGEPNASGIRLGQASRHGYITISPDWTKKGQVAYQYDAREHATVLAVLRDACRRFSVDTDRVFLSGHSIGGDAAWDIGIAHPDIWAGVIPITATADRYIAHYWQNAKYVPMYFVGGELDGTSMATNARDLDRYMTKPGYNVTVVEFLGRGHEHFYDEIQHLFDWMSICERNFFPTEFKTNTMRAWDNFFWWLELDDIPATAKVHAWPPPANSRAITTTASIKKSPDGTQTINVTTGADSVTVWLAPEMVDFNQRIKLVIKNRTLLGEQPTPNTAVLLEDARTRGDRQHPFWARVDVRR